MKEMLYRRLSFIYFLFSIFFGLCFTGCESLGTYNTATGKKEFIFVPTSEEIALGTEIHQQLLREYKMSQDAKRIETVNRIGGRLAQISDRQDYQYHFFLIEKDEQNAFTVPGGNVYIFTGLMDHLKTDDQIAAVLAHEIGHCAAKHTIKKFQAALAYDLIGNIVMKSVKLDARTEQIAAMSSGALMNLVSSAYSRQDELQADRLGVKYMYLSGFDLIGMIETLQILKTESKEGRAPLILRSHPYLDSRIIAVKNEIMLVKDKYGERE